MARLMNALQLALGSVGSGIQGYAQARAAEDEKKRLADALARQGRMDTAAAERQSMLDQLALGEKGFVERGVREERAKQASPAVGSMVSTALSSFGIGGGPAGVLPDMSTVQRAAGMYGSAPAQSFNVGGKTYDQMMTPTERAGMETAREEESRVRQLQEAARIKEAEARRAADAEKAKTDAAEAAWVAAGVPRDKAKIAAVTSAKYGDIFMNEKDMQALGISRGQASLAREKFEFDKEQASKPKEDKLASAKKAVQDVLPTVIAASQEVNKWGKKEVESLDPYRVAMQNSFTLQGGFWGATGSKLLSAVGGISDLDKQYLQYSSAVADAVARASEVGVLTNQDINRFRTQVLFDGGENQNQIQFKMNNLKSWAAWLASNKKNIENADGAIDRVSTTRSTAQILPGETEEEYKLRTGSASAKTNPYR